VSRNLINLIVKTSSSKAAALLKIQIGKWQFGSVEEVSLKAKEILMRELRPNTASSSERPRVTVSEEDDRHFLLDLFTHHPSAVEKGVERLNSLNVVRKGFSNKNSPCFFVS
jgi:hypothetical protein